MGKKKDQEQTTINGVLISGLPQKSKYGNIILEFEEDRLKIVEDGGFLKVKPIQTFWLDVDKIISIDLITQDNIVEKQKSTFGRGIAGAALFGPVGAIIATSSPKTETTVEKTGVIVVSYYGKNEDDIKTINLSKSEKWFLYVRNFIAYFRKHYRGEFQEKENGDIIL
ncbi:hypothetical protein [Eubacterium callanderi]|uniref:hypothetical protein n=1 Tax=Eubacterium callanderi TaxID=53442 RepID=UPI00391B65BB